MAATIKYRIWDSPRGWVDVETPNWLQHALKQSGIKQPYMVQFQNRRGFWHPVAPHAVNAAVKAVWGSEVEAS